MFLRYLSNVGRPLGVIAFLVGAGVAGVSFAAFAASYNSSVQTYVSEAVPVDLPQSHAYYDSPLAAGTLTLEDVLEAHRPRVDKSSKLPAINGIPSATATAPIIGTQSGQPSSTGMMLSEGMKAVLQKIGNAPAPAPAATALPSAASTNALATGGVSSDVISAANCATPSQPASGSPVPLSPDTVPSVSSPVAQKAERVTIDGVVYEPGQAPKNLATGSDAVASAENVTEPEASGGTSCGHAVKKWQKTCGEAGYPETYVGKIIGETRVGCSDSALHDVWVTNTCSPPDAVGAGNPDDNSEKVDAVCGGSAGQEFSSAPTEGLCEQGNPGDVEDGSEWSWSCSGINGGAAASCTAVKSVEDEDGECGEADGTPASITPSIALCLKGTATKVKGEGPWSWSCLGSGDGDRARCSAPVLSNDAEVEDKEQPAAEEVSDEDITSLKDAAAQAVADGYEALDIGEFCGTAAEVLAYEAPSSGLCRVGRSSTVDGNGPWSWTCTDNDGKSSSCRTLSLAGDSGAEVSAAPAKPVIAAALSDDSSVHQAASSVKKESTPVQPAGVVEGNHEEADPECGRAASKPSIKAPSSGLCAVGKAGAIHKGATWSWSCSTDKRKIFCESPKVIDAVCGAANGKSLESEPEDGLCAQGTPSAVEGGEAWRWVCKGSAGGADVSCAAAIKSAANKVDGTCGAYDGANMREVPAGDNLCASGSASAVSGEGPWTWSCSGVNGGRVGVCSANKVAPPKPPGPSVNGLCGRSNGVMASAKPSEGLCAAGIHSEVVGSGPWNWNCVGENGGMTVSCSAPLEPPAPIDGVCGSASGIPTLVKPKSGLCSSGMTGNVNGTGPWTWSCSGVNGGAPASCVAPVAGKTASVPSVMTTSSGVSSSVSSASGLKTPKLPSSSSVPALDRAAIPSLTQSKSVLKPPSLSSVPNAVAIKSSGAPDVVPDLPAGTSSIAPPSKPVVSKVVDVPGNRLSLDPEVSLIGFSKGSGNLNAEALPLLDKVAAILRDNADVRISLYAYADNQGSTPRAARRLSLKRAIAVRTYLVSKGIAESRMDVHAEGANVNYGSMDRVDIKVND